ncbi:MAG TPA: EamA family transporter [Firmicutes bacterium]|nr:EamA family transporter [Candidatus Fermentithermobacillaceae bacterium]
MGYVEIALAGVIWALTGPLIRFLKADGFTSWDVVLGRAFFSVTFLGLWLIWKGIRNKRMRDADLALPPVPDRYLPQALPTFFILGFIGVVVSQSSYFYALTQVSVAVAVTLNYTAPFFVLILSYLLYKEPITKSKGIALLGALLGVALVSGLLGQGSEGIQGSLAGILAGLVSGFSYGLQTVVYKSVGRKYGPIELNFWMMLTGALQLILFLSLTTGSFPTVFARMASASPKSWLLMTLIGLGPGTAAFVLFTDGINKVEAGRGSIVAMSEPVAACLLGYLALGEKLTWSQLLGVFLVIGSIVGISVTKAPGTGDSKTSTPERNRQVDQNA